MMKESGVKSQESRVKAIGYWLFIAFNVSAQILSGDEIMRVSKEKIESLVNDGRIEIEERKISDLSLPDGNLRLEANPSISYRNALVEIKILLDGKEEKRIKQSFRIRKFQDVFVAAKPLNTKDIITEDMIKKEEREITSISGYITENEKIVGKEVGRRIQEGGIILSHYIKEPPLIHFGDIVSLLKNGNGFSIKTKGMAISTGYKGKEISIRNLASNKIIKGFVVEKGTVEVK
ncbi:MAG: flagellar basal body P-ring formation chaperone FlgA [bacterium]